MRYFLTTLAVPGLSSSSGIELLLAILDLPSVDGRVTVDAAAAYGKFGLYYCLMIPPFFFLVIFSNMSKTAILII